MRGVALLEYSLLVFWLVIAAKGENVVVTFDESLEGQTNCHLRDFITVNLDTGSDILRFRLHRNDYVHPGAPSYTIHLGEDGLPEFKKDEEDHTQFQHQAAYQDFDHHAALLVTCLLHPQKGSQFEMEGTLFWRSVKYRIFTSKSPLSFFQQRFHSGPGKPYSFVRTEEAIPFDAGIKAAFHEEILKNSLQEIRLPSRRKREVSEEQQDIKIDVLLILEYSVIETWQNFAGGDLTKGKEDAKTYFALLMNAVNLRFKKIDHPDYKFNIRLVGYYISESENTSSWSEDVAVETNSGTTTDASKVLTNLRLWLNESYSSLVPYDHAMLFTSYDLTGNDTGFRFTYATGLAYTGTMCRQDGSSVSVVEDHGGFQSVGTATHEIGHSLGALHDGESNSCKAEDRYIMASESYPETEATKHNPWFFSNCSINYFVDFIKEKTEYKTCLTEYSNLTARDIPDVANTMPGQEYGPDKQCQHVYGERSYLCRRDNFNVTEVFCRTMFCYQPEKKLCLSLTAARGTTCGDKKWCIDGDCVKGDKAPNGSDTCPHGDQPFVRIDGVGEKYCQELIDEHPSLCYNSNWRSTCCSSCESRCKGPKDCPCGDRGEGCKTGDCGHYNQTYLDICCETCKDFTTVPTSESTQGSSAGPTAIESTTESTTLESTTESKTLVGSTKLPLVTSTRCADVQLFKSLTCPEYVKIFGLSACYNEPVSVACCRTCSDWADNSRNDCEWGDKEPVSCWHLRRLLGKNACPNITVFLDKCCWSCADLKGPETTPQQTAPTSGAVIVGYTFSLSLSFLFHAL